MADEDGDARWRLRSVFAQPWRLGLGAGAAVLALAACWWAAVQVLSAVARPPPAWAVAPALAHSAWMVGGFFPLFVTGFVFTAVPRWLQVPAPGAAVLVPAVAAQGLGWAAWMVAVHGSRELAGAALALVALGQADVARRLGRLVRASRRADRRHPVVLAVALSVGAVAVAGAGWATACGDTPVALGWVLTAFWGCVTVVFATAADRLVPAFDVGVREGRRGRLLVLVIGCCALRAADAWLVLPPPAWPALLALAQAAAGASIVRSALAWARARPLKTALVCALFLGTCWFGAGWLLAAVNAAALASGTPPPLPWADVHALGIAAFGLLLAGMVSRICASHGGRPLAIDCRPWILPAVQAAALLRLAAAPAAVAMAAPALRMASALVWSLALGGWALRILHEAGLPPPRTIRS